jgi:hypothetical protein
MRKQPLTGDMAVDHLADRIKVSSHDLKAPAGAGDTLSPVARLESRSTEDLDRDREITLLL